MAIALASPHFCIIYNMNKTAFTKPIAYYRNIWQSLLSSEID